MCDHYTYRKELINLRVFSAIENNDGTWRIECRCVIYRALHGKHPDWAKPTGDAVMGFNTKYYLLIEDNIKSMMKAIIKAEELESRYADIVRKCEDSGDWTDFPYKDNKIIFYK